MAALETRGLTKRFGDTVAVHNLDLTVDEGEVFGFLGPNGAGKSTTINMILDFMRPTAGSVAVLGTNPRQNPRAVRERIGVLPEGYDLYDRLTARKHVTFAIEMKRSNDDPETILERIGLAADADKAIGGYSKGMRQRLALGMALVGDPDLLVLDEPSSGLDPNGARAMREIISTEQDRGATVFFSSHIMEQVEPVCDRVGIMRDGELVAVDTVDGLRESAGAESTLVLSVDTVPQQHALFDIPGVTDVQCIDSTIHVNCSDSSVKADIITAVEATGTSVQDITIQDRSLDDLFAEYTTENAAEGQA
ncbi:ABC transporter ATP-binding protein [Halococcus agarilyticus]|uniref:ABC transporter ATP-binding protein n=1 Tax=Halococcus agarilyticus TaxID=1232219 RepID=UPI0006783343|nr:ABC transporter ATP-binding protein [Halococcus agarilyticus]